MENPESNPGPLDQKVMALSLSQVGEIFLEYSKLK